MLYAIALILAAGLVVALSKLHRHRQAVRRLEQAITQKQPFLREDLPGAGGAAWDELCATANRLISDVTRLQQQGAGQLA